MEVPGGLSPTAPPFLLLCHLRQWPSFSGGGGNTKTPRQSPSEQLEASLLPEVWIRQE